MANRITAYADDVAKEMKKVSWPTRTQLINNTAITLVASGIFALFIFGIDQVISRVLELVYGV